MSDLSIVLIEPNYTGARKRWAEEFNKFSYTNSIEAITNLDDNHQMLLWYADLVLVSDRVNLVWFLAKHEKALTLPKAIYVHDRLDPASAAVAQHIFFASQYQYDYFVAQQPEIVTKASVLPMAINLQRLATNKPAKIEKPLRAVVLWNHAWNEDSNPEQFFDALIEIAEERGLDFKLIVLGKAGESYPPIFDTAKEKLADKILHWGYADSEAEYAQWLWQADILPITAVQDFTGRTTLEAMYCNVVPYMPKRLVYPELIPEAYRNTFFYDEKDFVNKLQRRIWDVKYLRVMDTQQYAAKYDWGNLLPLYHSEFHRIWQQYSPNV